MDTLSKPHLPKNCASNFNISSMVNLKNIRRYFLEVNSVLQPRKNLNLKSSTIRNVVWIVTKANGR